MTSPVRMSYRAKVFHRYSTMAAVLVTMAFVAAACGSTPSVQSSGHRENPPGTLKPVTLQVYVGIHTTKITPDQKKVFAAADRIIKSKINATVDWHSLLVADYVTKMPTLLASRTPMDLLNMAPTEFGYDTYAEQGALYPMNSLLKKYGKGIEASMPKYMLNSGEVNGKIYGITYLQQNTLDPGWTPSEALLKAGGAKGIDADGNVFLTGKKPGTYNYKQTDMDSVYAKAAANKTYMAAHPNGFELLQNTAGGGNGAIFDPMAYGYWPITSGLYSGDPFYVKMGTTKVTMALPALESYFKMMRSFYKDGYLPKNAGSPPQTGAPVTAEYIGSAYDPTGGGYIGSAGTYNGAAPTSAAQRRAAELNVPESPRPFYLGYNGGWSISSTSSHPQRTMMLLNLLYTDPKLIDLLAYGFPKKDYNVVNGSIVPTKNDQSSGTSCWLWGNCWITPTWPYAAGTLAAGPHFWSEVKNWTDSAIVSPLDAFSFNTQPVSSQWSALASVIAQYDVPLFTGSQPLNTDVPKYVSALDKAGYKSVRQEVQKQLNAYLAKNRAAKKALLSDTYSKLMSESPTSTLAGPAPVESLAQALKTVPVG